jgi:hypothetical protein
MVPSERWEAATRTELCWSPLMKIRRTIVVFDAPNLIEESRFWADLQLATNHVPPEWPHGKQQQQMHLDVWVDDMTAAHEHVISLGARLLQPVSDPTSNEQYQVYADPAGHPFCLCWAEADFD